MTRTRVELLAAGTDPKALDQRAIGTKAYKLLELSRYGQLAGFRVPNFYILPATEAEEYYRNNGEPPPIAYTPLPMAHDIPQEALNHLTPFAQQYARTLEKWAIQLNAKGRPWFRSSITLDVGTPLTFAGVNYSFRPTPGPDDPFGISHSLKRLLAAMYRPYAEWYLLRHRLHQQRRPAAIMMMEVVEKAIGGTATIHGDLVYVCYEVLSRSGTVLGSQDLLFPLTSSRQRWLEEGIPPTYWMNLRQSLADLVSCGEIGSPLEVEFFFDQDGLLYLSQYRLLQVSDEQNTQQGQWGEQSIHSQTIPQKRLVAISHSVGCICGMLGNLYTAPRNPAELTRVLEETRESGVPRIWLVRDRGDAHWDGFALVWAHLHALVPGPFYILLGFDQIRQRQHLPMALREDPACAFIAQLPAYDLALLPSGTLITVESDGVQASTRIMTDNLPFQTEYPRSGHPKPRYERQKTCGAQGSGPIPC